MFFGSYYTESPNDYLSQGLLAQAAYGRLSNHAMGQSARLTIVAPIIPYAGMLVKSIAQTLVCDSRRREWFAHFYSVDEA